VAAAGSAGRDCIFERLRIEHGYAGGYTVVKDYVRTARARSREVFVPLVHPPGHAQVDFGECVGVIGGVRMKLHVFCFDLSQSDACFFADCVTFCEERVGDSSTVEQRTLTPSILVRIQVPQPYKSS
jgi:transposase